MNFQQLVNETLSSYNRAQTTEEPTQRTNFSKNEWAVVNDTVRGRQKTYKDKVGRVISLYRPSQSSTKFVLDFDGDQEWFTTTELKGPFDDKKTASKYSGNNNPVDPSDLSSRIKAMKAKALSKTGGKVFDLEALKENLVQFGFTDIDWDNRIEKPGQVASIYTTKDPSILMLLVDQSTDKHGNIKAELGTLISEMTNPLTTSYRYNFSNKSLKESAFVQYVVKLPAKRINSKKMALLEAARSHKVDWSQTYDPWPFLKKHYIDGNTLNFWKDRPLDIHECYKDFLICSAPEFDLNPYVLDHNRTQTIQFIHDEKFNDFSVPHKITISSKLELSFECESSQLNNVIDAYERVESINVPQVDFWFPKKLIPQKLKCFDLVDLIMSKTKCDKMTLVVKFANDVNWDQDYKLRTSLRASYGDDAESIESTFADL